LAPYAREIREAAERYGVEEGLIKAVIRAESGFNSRAVSPKGARGLMQLMPGTASMLGVRDSFDPRQNIDGGVRHLRALIDRFGSDLKLALAAYNAGEQAVITHGGIPPYRETRDYVTRIRGFFSPAPVAPLASEPRHTYRTVAPDGTITYTNIPRMENFNSQGASPRRPRSVALEASPHQMEEAFEYAFFDEDVGGFSGGGLVHAPHRRQLAAVGELNEGALVTRVDDEEIFVDLRGEGVARRTAGPPSAMAGKNSPSSLFISHTSVTTTPARPSDPPPRALIARLRS
jgi:hypothetical protein